MPLDLSLELVGLFVLGGLAVLCIVAVVASGRAEELDAGLVAVLPEPVGEDFIAEPQLTMADLESQWAFEPAMREDALHAKPYNVEEDWR